MSRAWWALGLLLAAAPGCSTLPAPAAVSERTAAEAALEDFAAGQWADEKQDFEAAVGYYRRALEQDPGSLSVRRSLVGDLLRLGRPEQALEEFKPIVRRQPDDPKTLYLMGQLHEAAGNTAEALALYQHIVQNPAAGSESWTALGQLLLKLEREPEGIRSLATAVHKNPLDREARRTLVKYHIGQGRADLAEDLLRQGLEVQPDSLEWLNLLARVLRLRGRTEESFPLFQRVLELDPNAIEARQVLAEEYLLRRQWRAASEQLEWLLKLDPANPLLRRNLGLAYFESGELEAAREQLAPLIEQKIADSLAHFIMGLYYQRRKLWRLAEQAFRAAIELEPNSAQAYLELADVLILSQDPDTAARVLDNLESRLRITPQRWARAGSLWARLKNPRRAAEAFGQALKLAPRDPLLYLQRGKVRLELDQFEAAVNDWERAVALDPKLAEAYNYLGYAHAERGVKLDRAVAWIKRALHLDPHNGNYRDSLGWAYFQQGKYQPALEELQSAVDLLKRANEPIDPVIEDHLGQVLLKLGRLSEAETAWTSALERDPGNADLRDRLRLLREQRHNQERR